MDARPTASTLESMSTTSALLPLARAGCPEEPAEVRLYWLPLGAGGHCVRLNGRVFEAIAARKQHRRPCDLYHSALEIKLGPDRYVIEMAPVWNDRSRERGVVGEGSVGMRGAGRFRLFRYEIRCWRDGHIPDVREAVDSPQCLSTDPDHAARVICLVRQVPTAVWGRDELGTGDMWNSNSLVSWLIATSGISVEELGPPSGGRAPGWHAGLVAAARRGPDLTHLGSTTVIPVGSRRIVSAHTKMFRARRPGFPGREIWYGAAGQIVKRIANASSCGPPLGSCG